jgi:hypothetical protein
MLVAGPRLDAHAIGGVNTVTVNPGHGQATVRFQVTYAVSPCVGAAGLTIGFSWGALPAAGRVLGTAVTDTACRATLSATPPVSAATHQPPAPGSYLVFGYVALPTGTATPNMEASASYTVDVTVTPAPTATAHASASARPSASAAATPAAAASPSAPAAPIEPGAPASVTAEKAAAARPAGEPDASTLTWQVVVGSAVLALAILALLAFMIASIARRQRARGAASLRNNGVA